MTAQLLQAQEEWCAICAKIFLDQDYNVSRRVQVRFTA